MTKDNFFFNNHILPNNLNQKSIDAISKNYNKIIKNIFYEIDQSNKTLFVLNKKYKFNFNIKDLKKFQNFKTIALIGMGGSILGSEAINCFLKDKIKKKIYFFDNLDNKKLLRFKKTENPSKVLFLIISKSGNTLETITNTFFLNILKKNSKNIILISEKKNNFFYSLSKKLNLYYVEHKKNIGGRYSVLSEVGILPAYLMGLDIIKLRSNIQKFLKKKGKSFLKDSSIKLASLINSKKINNLIFLCYSSELEKFLFWCQQLIAESLGKEGKGFLPVISNVPKDHHSLLQLFIDGPADKLFHIFSFDEKSKQKVSIKNSFNMINFLKKKSLSEVKYAQKAALIKVFKKQNIPFREFKIKKLNEETLGELFSYFILETVIIGKLIKVNPFNQPKVEQVKINTKKLLS